ncbi:oxidoreductase [Oceanivirga salmonicida]|uniref:oxidoreductase n=1 Tax=Oceanivirga salmonicida TaxID=1769291 RepID=UPI0012E2D949|nr:NADPH dehydrogenase [Oceanivirga salmonicida]
MSKLLSKIKIGRNTFKNRVVMAPMCMFHNKTKNGVLTNEHYDHYVARALGGVAGIIVEATMVNEKGGIRKLDLGLYNDEQMHAFSKLTKRVHEYNTVIGIQISHAGIKADKDYDDIIGPSVLENRNRELSISEIEKLISEYTNSAVLAKKAGFDFVEIHGAHGYLVSQFLSPLTNKRNDIYGGSLEKRYKFLGDIIKEIKKNVDIDIHVRISADEYSENGNSLDDIIQILKWAKEDGVVFNNISSGGIVTGGAPEEVYSGYQAKLSRNIKRNDLKCSAVGLLTDYGLCEYLLQSDACDLIYEGRALLRNPNFVYGAAIYFNETDKIEYPLSSYGRI